MARDDVAPATIAAIATAAGRGGIGIVRVSGSEAARIASSVIGRIPPPRTASVCSFHDARGEPIDHGMALFFPAPHSYTGESVLELHGHGGPFLMQALLAACIDAGCRLAEPGEFTRRAYLSGKLDLAQAEAVADLIDASSREAARSAMRSLSGEFSSAIGVLVAQLIELRTLVEALLDFPEEEIEPFHLDDAATRLDRLLAGLRDVMGKSRQGSLLRSGIHVVIAGQPNVGKSSLLNRLSGEERAIVTPVAGTTRDALREPIQIEGVPIILVDTAGLRVSSEEVERLGMERTRLELQRADVVLEVLVAGPEQPLREHFPQDTVRIPVYNKSDLAPGFVPVEDAAVLVSAKTGAGLESLRKALLEAAGWVATGESVFLARERHVRALGAAFAHVQAAREAASQWEFLAEELRLAQQGLASITGEFSTEDLLGEIFSRFCVGK